MSELDHNRRDLLAAMAGVAVGGVLGGHAAIAQAPAARGYHLGAAEGETVVRPSGDIVIKVDPTRGSPARAMGTQHLKAGAGIPVHRHLFMDEILLIQEGRGFAILDDQRTPMKGLMAWLKANPDKATAGTAGVGSPPHVFATFFQSATETRFRFVGYRGGAQAMQDLAAGHIDFMIDAQANALPLVRDGKEIFPREQQTPEALHAFQKAEIEKWWPIIKAAGIKAE